MRGNPQAHELIAPSGLQSALELLATEPGQWTPIAGGTEIMVAHAAGKLASKRLISLWNLSELRFISTTTDTITIGAGTTFAEIRSNATIVNQLPLLSQAASWIGAIANQSRATLGGNLVNGSPAADSSPALLVYDAKVETISLRAKRRIPYSEFHTGYKQNILAPDELLYAVHIPLRFAHHRQYIRKVGTRRAMAISKVALAATALLESKTIREIRIAAASLAPFPTRLYRAEATLLNQPVQSGTTWPETIRAARTALLAEVAPIDDIRSTADYRSRVAANLLEEFLASLKESGHA
jgi:CO/xanthine dehydrogenase FAD-binding subunit